MKQRAQDEQAGQRQGISLVLFIPYIANSCRGLKKARINLLKNNVDFCQDTKNSSDLLPII
jgi:hypothetical protein